MKEEFRKVLKNRTGFYDILVENTRDYKGEFEDVIHEAPEIYDLLCCLLDSKNITKDERNRLSAAIAYFILPRDIFPEETFGTKGYLDDVYLCLYVLREIEREHELEELLEHWKGNVNVLKRLLDKDFKRLDEKYGYILHDVLSYIGLE